MWDARCPLQSPVWPLLQAVVRWSPAGQERSEPVTSARARHVEPVKAQHKNILPPTLQSVSQSGAEGGLGGFVTDNKMSALWLQSLTPITTTQIVQHNRHYRTWLHIDYFTSIDQKGDHDGAIEVLIQTDQKHKTQYIRYIRQGSTTKRRHRVSVIFITPSHTFTVGYLQRGEEWNKEKNISHS